MKAVDSRRKFFVLAGSCRRAWERCRPSQLQTGRRHPPSSGDRPARSRHPLGRGPLLCRQAHTVANIPLDRPRTRRARGSALRMGTPAPVGSAVVDAVAETRVAATPRHVHQGACVARVWRHRRAGDPRQGLGPRGPRPPRPSMRGRSLGAQPARAPRRHTRPHPPGRLSWRATCP